MRIDTAAPMLNEMKALGIDLQNVPGLLDALPQDLKSSLNRELTTIASGKLQPDVAKVHMANVIGVLRGEKNLGDIDGTKARQILTSTAYSFTVAQAANVAKGQGDAEGWLNMSRQVVLASQGVNRGSGADTLTKAISGIARADNINAIDKLRNQSDTREEATILAHASRAGAAHLVSQARYAMVAESKTATGHQLVWDRQNAQFVIKDDPSWKPSARTGGGTGAMRGEYVGMTARPAVPASLQALVRSTNEGISYLARTTGWDADAPKGTVREVRAFYARDEATSDMKAKAASGKGSKGPSDILQLGSQIERDLANTPDLVTAPGGNSDILGPEGTARNPRSTATGAGQFTEKTWLATLKSHAPELIEGKSRQDILDMRQNKGLATRATGWLRGDNATALGAKGIPGTPANTAVAHFLGASDASKLIQLANSNPDAPASSVLDPDSIRSNPELLGRGESAAATLARIKKFYGHG